MTTLCIVDMQDFFNETAGRCVEGVLKEVELAKARSAAIVVLEYGYYHNKKKVSPTLKVIRDALKGYRKKRYVVKVNDDGGEELINTLEKNKWSTDKIRFTGVNRSFCVHDTVSHVHTIRGDKTEIEIAIDATWCEFPVKGRADLRRYGTFVETYGITKPYRNRKKTRLPQA